jgi:hypothetical protein
MGESVYLRIIPRNRQQRFERYIFSLRLLTTTTDASNDAVNFRILFVRVLLRWKCRCGNIGNTRLVMTCRRGPGPGHRLVASLPPVDERGRRCREVNRLAGDSSSRSKRPHCDC